MYKERLEGFPFMTEMDIKQMAVYISKMNLAWASYTMDSGK